MFLPAFPFCAAAQAPCSRGALDTSSRAVAEVRRQLHTAAVPASSEEVPPAVAQELKNLKDSLDEASRAAFACASRDASPESVGGTLDAALHANLASAVETVETKSGQDTGAYGAGLTVEVLELAGAPRIFEVDFRYGMECGDDNLLLLFEAGAAASDRWRETLRWDAPNYTTVGDALGDFVMLTPVLGNIEHPRWRYVVAHGRPGCGKSPRPSRFALDLLSPAEDGARPTVDWHFEGGYRAGEVEPRLETTEDSIDFHLIPAQAAMSPKAAAAGMPGNDVGRYQFHLAGNGTVQPGPSTTSTPAVSGTPAESSSGGATKHSPR